MRHQWALAEPAPRLIASSVVRGSRLCESHGGVCVVDFASGCAEHLLDWNTTDIDIDGRGGDRGLRGIAISGEDVYIASTCSLLRFDRYLKLRDAFHNSYLRHCHEISVHAGVAHIVSTGYDSIVAFDVRTKEFTSGLHIRAEGRSMRVLAFDPRTRTGPQPSNVFHLNSVFCDESGLYFAGLRTAGLLRVLNARLSCVTRLPAGTHNARPFRDGIIFNDTANDRVRVRFSGRDLDMPISVPEGIRFDWNHAADPVLARPLFARGLCVLSSRYIAVGQSPSTVTLYDIDAGQAVAQLELSKDVRNAIHGLASWPFLN